MAKQSMWDLLQRNVRGTFWGGIDILPFGCVPLLVFALFVFIGKGLIFLLLFALTLAGIKTMADSWFRKPLEDAELQALEPIITQLKEKEVNGICNSVKNVSVSSLSPLCLVSDCLLQSLSLMRNARHK